MMLRPSLSAKILFLTQLNLCLFVSVFLIFARLQFRFDLSSFLLRGARDRIVSISSLLALQLPYAEPAAWNKLLAQYSSNYPAEFFLFDHTGRQLAGKPVALPESS